MNAITTVNYPCLNKKIFANLEELINANIENDMICRVESLKCDFMFDVNSTTTADGITVIAAADGGRWLRQTTTDPTWSLQDLWVIDPINGSDENAGSGNNSPIQTWAEWIRRTNEQIKQSTRVYVITDIMPEINFKLTESTLILRFVGRE